jgi:multiple sugar transport system ATP-binding protein
MLAADPMAQVVLVGIGKRFGDVEVLKPLDLEISDGEFLVLLGPSGCGKSTTLRIIAGLETPSEGKLVIGDRDVTKLAPKDRDVAMVFQSYALYPHLSVRENLMFGLKVRGTPKAESEKLISDVSAMLGLEQLLERKPKELSGGQRQRVAMGRAIVRRPKVFLFDEPLSNLDAALRTQMRAEIASLHRRLGITTVYVTHDQVEAMTLASRIVILHQGVVQQIGRPMEVYARPANAFVGRFLGAPAMNQIAGEVKTGPIFTCPGFEVPLPSKASEHVGKSVVIGVRPQSLLLVNDGPIKGIVEIVEPTGGESFIRLKVGEHHLTARVEGTPGLDLGSDVALTIDPSAVHLFASRSGEAGETLL